MDWGKAKSILIAVLIVTNLIVLGFISKSEFGENKPNPTQVYNYTVSVLNQNNIFLDDLIMPDDAGKMPSLTVAYDTFNQSSINSDIAAGHYVISGEITEDSIKEYSEKILSYYKIMDSNVVCAGAVINGDDATVTYKNTYENIPVEECEMKFTFHQGKLINFQRKWIDVVQESDAKQNTLSPVSALLMFMKTVDKTKEVHIEKMQIVYLLESYEIENEQPIYDTAFPAWQITYNKGNVIYISAFEQ